MENIPLPDSFLLVLIVSIDLTSIETVFGLYNSIITLPKFNFESGRFSDFQSIIIISFVPYQNMMYCSLL